MPVFRRVEKEDMQQIASLEKETFSDAWSIVGLQETLEQEHAFITVAEEDSKVVAYCIVYHVMDEGEIARIAVNRENRRQGVGQGLLDYTCDCCREKELQRLLLDVRESNVGARAFYKQYGFVEDGIRKNFYDNPKENAVLMSKRLA